MQANGMVCLSPGPFTKLINTGRVLFFYSHLAACARVCVRVLIHRNVCKAIITNDSLQQRKHITDR